MMAGGQQPRKRPLAGGGRLAAGQVQRERQTQAARATEANLLSNIFPCAVRFRPAKIAGFRCEQACSGLTSAFVGSLPTLLEIT